MTLCVIWSKLYRTRYNRVASTISLKAILPVTWSKLTLYSLIVCQYRAKRVMQVIYTLCYLNAFLHAIGRREIYGPVGISVTPALSCRDQFEPEASALQGQRSTADLPARFCRRSFQGRTQLLARRPFSCPIEVKYKEVIQPHVPVRLPCLSDSETIIYTDVPIPIHITIASL